MSVSGVLGVRDMTTRAHSCVLQCNLESVVKEGYLVRASQRSTTWPVLILMMVVIRPFR
jgi:hypothetical protein